MLNKFYQNIDIRGYFKRYGFLNGLKRGMFSVFPLHFVKDYELKKILWQKSAARYVNKYFRYKSTTPAGLIYGSVSIPKNPVWVFWSKGYEGAPEIVKKCIDSIKKYSGGNVVLLTFRSATEYVKMPPKIMTKVRDGSISTAAYTDLLRFALLSHFGGTWIDATVFLSGPISPYIMGSDLFLMRNTMMLVENPVFYPAWFIHCSAGNKVISQARNVTFAYWEKENRVIEYLLPNLILTGILRGTEEEKLIPYMSTDYSEYMLKCLGDKYDSDKLKWLYSLTGIHKLSYKLDDRIKNGNTLFKHLISSEEQH